MPNVDTELMKQGKALVALKPRRRKRKRKGGGGGGGKRGKRGKSQSLTRGTRTEEGLTVKQQRFALELVRTGNAVESYTSVYGPGGDNIETLKKRAYQMMRHVKVQAEIGRIHDRMLDKLTSDAAKALSHTAALAYSDPLDVFTIRDGELYVRDLESVPPSARKTISQVHPTKDGLRLTFVDRLRALDLLHKIHGSYAPEKSDQRVLVGYFEDMGDPPEQEEGHLVGADLEGVRDEGAVEDVGLGGDGGVGMDVPDDPYG